MIYLLSEGNFATKVNEAKLGFISPYPQIWYGLKNAIELAIDEYNSANDANVSVVYLDDKNDATEGGKHL